MNQQPLPRYVPGMHSLLRYEARHCGGLVLTVPPLAGVAVGGATSMGGPAWHSLLASHGLPLLVAVPAVSTMGDDPVRELHTSVPQPYQRTAGYRLAIACGAIAAAILVAAVLGASSGHLTDPLGFAALAACSSAFLVGVGAATAAWSDSTAAASSVLIAIWFGQLLVGERILGDGPARLLVPAFAGCASIVLALHRVGSDERARGSAGRPRSGR